MNIGYLEGMGCFGILFFSCAEVSQINKYSNCWCRVKVSYSIHHFTMSSYCRAIVTSNFRETLSIKNISYCVNQLFVEGECAVKPHHPLLSLLLLTHDNFLKETIFKACNLCPLGQSVRNFSKNMSSIWTDTMLINVDTGFTCGLYGS